MVLGRTGFVVKKDEGKQNFAGIFNPERFDESLQTELREKGDQESLCPGTRTFVHKTIDLHGYTASRAERFLKTFFMTARQEGVYAVSIITGKGVHSQGPAVLPDLAEQKMREFQAIGLITSFYWEKGSKERSGKLIAYLKKD